MPPPLHSPGLFNVPYLWLLVLPQLTTAEEGGVREQAAAAEVPEVLVPKFSTVGCKTDKTVLIKYQGPVSTIAGTEDLPMLHLPLQL